MGDRAMAEIKTEGGSLYVYTHWGGSDLVHDAQKAIMAAKERWGDLSYATHIIVDQLTKHGRDQETGYGIMLKPNAEDEYNHNEPSVVIDLVNRNLEVKRETGAGVFPFDKIIVQAVVERLGGK